MMGQINKIRRVHSRFPCTYRGYLVTTPTSQRLKRHTCGQENYVVLGVWSPVAQVLGQNPTKVPKPSWNTPIGGGDQARCGCAAVPGLEWADFGAGSKVPRCKSTASVKVCLGRSVPFGNELLSRAIGQQALDLGLEGIELTFPRIVALEIPKIRDLSVG